MYVEIVHLSRELRVGDVVGSAADTTVTFPQGTMTIANYFQQRYGALRYSKLPMLSLGSGKGNRKNYMPLEVSVTIFTVSVVLIFLF